MSSRHYRKKLEEAALPPTEEESDGDYEPLYAQNNAQSKYTELLINQSDSETTHTSEHSGHEVEEEENACAAPAPSTRTSKKKNNRKKMRQRMRGQQAQVNTLPDSDSVFDEVERSVMEVNAMLGTPPPAPAPVERKETWASKIFVIQAKHLNVATELKRLFGPEEAEQNRRARVQPNRTLMLKRVFVHPNKDTAVYDFKKSGLSMSKYKEEDGVMYFIFNHDEQYQKMHRQFLRQYATTHGAAMLMRLDDARRNMHVEALIEMSDILFRMEENNVANEIVENVATYLQYVAHPAFLLNNPNVRLEYKYMENRPFHVVMLKYIYLLSNKACHRTALEICKMLLVIDPSDPLALLCLIDTLALRAREHEWLVEATDYFIKEREADLMYNIKYSLAMANFHVATKNKADLSVADKMLKDAMLQNPAVWVKIMECASVSNPRLTEHDLFESPSLDYGAPGFEELFMMYAKMTWPRWRETNVLEWAVRNATELCHLYDTDILVRASAKLACDCRYGVFQMLPKEYLRHLSVLSNMSKLILEGTLTPYLRPSCGWDPLYDKGVNRYNYEYRMITAHRTGGFGLTIYRFFQSMIPSSYSPPPVEE